jgi:hypothetical protein
LKLVDPLTFKRSIRSVHLNIWDEKTNRLLSFRALAPLLKQRAQLA